MTEHRFTLPDEAATEAFAAALAAKAPVPARIYLHGDLGVGKTALVRAYLRALGFQGAVRSPSYTLVEPYEMADRAVIHMDLYRLADPEELEFLGLRDYLESATQWLVEWPERGLGFLPEADLVLNIRYGEAPDSRVVTCSGRGDDWFLAALPASV